MLRRLGDASEQIMAVAISSDGSLAASGGAAKSGAGVTRVWESASGTLRLPLPLGEGRGEGFADRRGKPLTLTLSQGERGQGRLLWTMADHEREVLAVAFTPDASLVATASSDGTVKIREARSGRVVRTLDGHQGGATSLACSPDGAWLVCGEGHGGTRVWDIATGRLLRTCSTTQSAAEAFRGDRLIHSIGLSRDGSALATCNSSINNEFIDPVRIFDPETGALMRSLPREVHGRPMGLSPDGALVATGGKSVKLWDTRTGKLVRELYGHLKRTQSILFSADGRLLVAGGSYGTTNAWEVATGRHLVTLFAFSGTRDGKLTDDWLAYTPDSYFAGSPGIERYLAWRVG
jgi:WD40 repeat protein